MPLTVISTRRGHVFASGTRSRAHLWATVGVSIRWARRLRGIAGLSAAGLAQLIQGLESAWLARVTGPRFSRGGHHCQRRRACQGGSFSTKNPLRTFRRAQCCPFARTLRAPGLFHANSAPKGGRGSGLTSHISDLRQSHFDLSDPEKSISDGLRLFANFWAVGLSGFATREGRAKAAGRLRGGGSARSCTCSSRQMASADACAAPDPVFPVPSYEWKVLSNEQRKHRVDRGRYRVVG